MKDFDQETWIPTSAMIRDAVIDAYARLSKETRVQTILAWTNQACCAFPADRNAVNRYLIWLLYNAEEAE